MNRKVQICEQEVTYGHQDRKFQTHGLKTHKTEVYTDVNRKFQTCELGQHQRTVPVSFLVLIIRCCSQCSKKQLDEPTFLESLNRPCTNEFANTDFPRLFWPNHRLSTCSAAGRSRPSADCPKVHKHAPLAFPQRLKANYIEVSEFPVTNQAEEQARHTFWGGRIIVQEQIQGSWSSRNKPSTVCIRSGKTGCFHRTTY